MSMGWVPAQAVYVYPFQNELLRIQKQNMKRQVPIFVRNDF